MSKIFLGFDMTKCWDYENGFYRTSPIKIESELLIEELPISHVPAYIRK